MTKLVVDASVALAWTLSTQKTSAADALRVLANIEFVAPFIFVYEVRNALRKAEREKRISGADADQALAEFDTVMEVVEPPDEASIADALKLARDCNLSFYDANYVELARRIGCTLATRDGPMIAAAPKAGIAIYDAR
ncbi:MAG: type II toxin-antitoxin system VapC family toxin [Vitreimonas sp.]